VEGVVNALQTERSSKVEATARCRLQRAFIFGGLRILLF
jgi:hypothetical protein